MIMYEDPIITDFPLPAIGERIITWDGIEATVKEYLPQVNLYIVETDDGGAHGLYAEVELLPWGENAPVTREKTPPRDETGACLSERPCSACDRSGGC
jgi:hypothetical protein